MAKDESATGLDRKTAIVTGGASGIGLAMARHFASQGYNVAVLDVVDGARAVETCRNAAEDHTHRPTVVVVFKRCDVSSWQSQADAFRAIVDDFGRVDVVCANAGISERGASAIVAGVGEPGEPLEPDLRIMDVDLTGVIYSVKLAIHYMAKNQPSGAPLPSRGSIICTASNAGLYPFPVSPLYAAAKSGVIGLVRSTAPVLERHKIQINALAPAVLVTNIAPDKALFEKMTITPMSTLVDGVSKFMADPSLSGEVAEIHGDKVTLRPPHDYVDEDSRKNLENFWNLGYA